MRRRRPVRRPKPLRLLTISWLVEEDQVLTLVAGLQASGMSVSVSPRRYLPGQVGG
jgi:hypothetical protein